jgi:hypothetical protein
MNRNYFIWTICPGLILVAWRHGLSDPPAKQPEELVVISIKAIEESDEGRSRQTVSEPRLTTKIGRPTQFLIGGQVLHDSEYIDIGQRFEFLPTKRAGKDAIWVELRVHTTDYVIDKQGNGQLVDTSEKITAKYQLGKKNATKAWKTPRLPGSSILLEFRLETMISEQYERMLAEDAAARSAEKK